jgi:hypothetical protein
VSLDPGPILKRLSSIAMATGKFASTNRYEPRGQPANGCTLVLLSGPMTPIKSSGMNRVSLRWQIDGQIYLPLHKGPPEQIDELISDAAADYLERLCAQFTLGGLVRCVDVHGMDGAQLAATPGYIEHSGKHYRCCQLMIPLLINETWTLTP